VTSSPLLFCLLACFFLSLPPSFRSSCISKDTLAKRDRLSFFLCSAALALDKGDSLTAPAGNTIPCMGGCGGGEEVSTASWSDSDGASTDDDDVVVGVLDRRPRARGDWKRR